MKRLICIYDSKLANNGTYSFMKAIRGKIKDVEFLDVNNPNVGWKYYYKLYIFEDIKVLTLRPMVYKNEFSDELAWLIAHDLDKRGKPLVVEAILRVLGDVKGKSVVVLNQSMNIGIPLVSELMRRKATVHSFGSKTNVECEMADIIPDWIILATGDAKFKLDKEFLKDAKVIDLSNDTDVEDVIRKVPTVEVLKERLK